MEFLKFFLSNDDASIDYALQWMSISLRERNLTFLTLLASQGSGKGTLTRLLELIHGEKNAKQIKAESINARFNSFLAGATLLTINEITKLNNLQLDSIKLLNEGTLQIENKGVDKMRHIENHLNVIISSNNLDALKITSDDRRYSIIEVSDEKLQNRFPNLKDFRDELYCDETIAQFAAFLWHRPYEEKTVYTPFKSKANETLIESMRREPYQEELEGRLVDEFKGFVLLASDLAKFIKANNIDRNVSANKIKSYCRESSKALKFTIEQTKNFQTHYWDDQATKLIPCQPNFEFRERPQDLIVFPK
jgi:hypothetical protein